MELSISILALGSTYALLAAGIVIIYKASRVINFAHGELAIVGAYVFHSAGFLTGATLTGPSVAAAAAIAAAGSALFGVLIYFALMRRLLGRPTFIAAMVTIGLGIVLKAAIVVIWKSRSVGIPIGRQPLYNFAGGGRIAWIELISILTCIAAFAALAVFFQYTRLGRQFRGAAENPLLAAQRQVNINLILALAWGLAVFSAALAGVLFGSRSMLSPQSTIIGLSGLTAALVGGLDSLRGAAVGGMLVAAATYLTARLISPTLSETVPFLILLAVMNWRPWGLFGTVEELNRV
ncbi:MAG: branched-chain amino acid ABC transporter permease [Xanthobacteraceae bacterium]